MKDKGTHLGKLNPQGSIARKLKIVLQSRAPLPCGGVVGTMADRHHWCSDGVPSNTQSKDDTGEKGEIKDQVPRIFPRAEQIMMMKSNISYNSNPFSITF